MSEEQAPFAFDGLDRALHEKARLGIVAALASAKKARSFTELMTLCALTSGNLNRHLRILEDEGLVEISKGYQANRPHTACTLTAVGRARFLAYLDVLEGIVRHAAGGESDASPATKPALLPSSNTA